MSILLNILVLIVLTFLLRGIIAQSHNIVFMFFKRPYLWFLIMGLISFITFFIGSRFDNSLPVVCLSVAIAFFFQIPPRANKETINVINESYEAMGINRGRLKYRIGLASYILGGLIGWFVFYGVIIK
jgi:hypothetical protein